MKYKIMVPLVVEVKDQAEAFALAQKLQFHLVEKFQGKVLGYNPVGEDELLDVPEPVEVKG